jgi:hypothetical protein
MNLAVHWIVIVKWVAAVLKAIRQLEDRWGFQNH